MRNFSACYTSFNNLLPKTKAGHGVPTDLTKGVYGLRTDHAPAEPKARLTMVRASSCIWRRCSGPLKLSV